MKFEIYFYRVVFKFFFFFGLNIRRHTLGLCGTNPLDYFLFLERHRTETHTHTEEGGNPGLISHNSQHTKASNSWMLCEGFKLIGRHTLGQYGTNPLDCFFFFWERHRTKAHTQDNENPSLIPHNSQHTKPGTETSSHRHVTKLVSIKWPWVRKCHK